MVEEVSADLENSSDRVAGGSRQSAGARTTNSFGNTIGTSRSWRSGTIFFIFGLVNNFAYVVFLSAAEDVLERHAGAVLFADVVPGLLLKASLGLWFQRAAYSRLVSIVSLVGTIAFLLASLCAEKPGALERFVLLAAIAFISVAGALGEATFLALTALYGDETLAAWSSGTGFAGVVGASSYAVLVSVLRLRPRTALACLACTPLILAAAYRVLPRPGSALAMPSVWNTGPRTKTVGSSELAQPTSSLRPALGDASLRPEPGMPLFLQLLRWFLLPLGIVYFAEYSINQGVLPTFDGNPLYDHAASPGLTQKESNHRLYRTSQVVYQVAVFLSRSSIFLFRIQRLWIFPVMQLGNFVLLCMMAMKGQMFPELFRSFLVVGCIVFTEGLLGGASYANTFWSIRVASHPQVREWALAISTVADAFGITLASVFGSFLECKILASQGRACRGLLSR